MQLFDQETIGNAWAIAPHAEARGVMVEILGEIREDEIGGRAGAISCVTFVEVVWKGGEPAAPESSR